LGKGVRFFGRLFSFVCILAAGFYLSPRPLNKGLNESAPVMSLVQTVKANPSSSLNGRRQSLSESEAFLLLQQSTFGPKESDLSRLVGKTAESWLTEQFAAPVSSYSGRDRDQISKWSTVWGYDFCRSFAEGSAERGSCYDQYFSSSPVRRDFFKNAINGPDQLRQRVAFALSQIVVISENDLPGGGTYGFADYQQMLTDKAFGTYSDLLRSVTLHPLMGRYLTLLHSEKSAPNENYARELLQLFSIGLCELNSNGTVKSGVCIPTYDNQVVREYAYALTGYTNPVGGTYAGETYGLNPGYAKGEMVVIESRRDKAVRRLLSGVQVPAGSTAAQALNAVIQSIEKHPNFAPFVSKQLIQFLVTSNPSEGYVQRVVSAFNAGKHAGFGSGAVGDLKATVAAILLDEEARNPSNRNIAGKLREPTLLVTSLVRALEGSTDGEEMGTSWQSTGTILGQPFMWSPSVFNFYTPDYQLPGSNGVLAPQFQLVTPNSTIGWFNAVDDLVYGWYGNGNGLPPRQGIPGAVGTKLNFNQFSTDAVKADVLVKRLDRVLTGSKLLPSQRDIVQQQVEQITQATPVPQGSSWAIERVKLATFLIASSANFIVQR
jgi:uncharacterized protein (DUF1800 family)